MLVSLWRTVVMFLLVTIVMRFMGKRQIGELQPSELATSIMISNIAAIPIENFDSPLLYGAIPIITLACLEVLLSAVLLKSRTLRGFLAGKPRFVIRDGVIDQMELRELRWSIDDLMEQLRGNGVFDISDVSYAVIETNGNLSVYQKFPSRPATNESLHVASPKFDEPPVIVISDGKIVPKALAAVGLNENWLQRILRQENRRASEIFLLSCTRAGDYHLVLKEAKQ